MSSCYRVQVGDSDVLDVIYSIEDVGKSLVLGDVRVCVYKSNQRSPPSCLLFQAFKNSSTQLSSFS